MKYRVWHKYFLGYFTIAILVALEINVFGYRNMQRQAITRHTDTLYEEAMLIADQYRESYIEAGVTKEEFIGQMQMVSVLLDAQILLCDREGNMIAVAEPAGTKKYTSDEPEVNIQTLRTGILEETVIKNLTLEGMVKKPSLAVVEPMIIETRVHGYLIICQPMEDSLAEAKRQVLTANLNSIAILVGVAFLLGFLFHYHKKNITKLIKGAVAYTDGEFSHEMNIKGKDEYRELGNSIHYLAEQHSNLVNYQKTFIANISHDFRSPLTSIKGYAEAMKDGTIPYEIQGKYLDIILFETERLSNLTNDLLDLSNFENKGVRLDYTKFDVTKMLRQSAMTFEGKCSQKNLKIRLVFAENEIMVYADRGKIQQVVHNLIDNAIKFSHEDSTIEVTARLQRGKAMISVKDHGIGIPKEAISKVWERFYKTDLSRGKDKKGTGLGLAITKQIIAAHNENIKVVSTEGVGTEFVFSLALAE